MTPLLLRTLEQFVKPARCELSPYHVLLLLAVALVTRKLYRAATRSNTIPIYGETGPFAETRTRFTALTKCGPALKPFKIRVPGHEIVILTNPAAIKELGRADDAVLSVTDALLDVNIHHYLGTGAVKNPYHTSLLSKSFSVHLGSLLPGITNELRSTFEETAKVGADWKRVNVSDVMMNCISRTSNLVFVGDELCRDAKYIACVRDFSAAVMGASMMLDNFPAWLAPLIRPLLLDREKVLKEVMHFLTPIFIARRTKLEALGDAWTNRPKDAIQWILEAAPSKHDLHDMSSRILFLNFAAIHTSTTAILQALFDLAAHPHHIPALRSEIESALRTHGGWTPAALNSMTALDSALRESLRLHGPVGVTAFRKARAAYTFADGTRLERGATVATAANPIQRSEAVYDDPEAYDALRFKRVREQPGRERECQVTSATSEFLVFGVGKHACPGRFFLANELKILLAYVLCNYEFRFKDGETRPESLYLSLGIMADPTVEMEFRWLPERGSSFWNAGE
ncbi:cytochrome P450 [Geopyxis carbonaria]|nr:cytochrome P450 [Geopyxis carbonaria]